MGTPIKNINEPFSATEIRMLENRAIIDNIPFPAWIKSINGKFIYVNQAYANFFGMTKEKIIGLTNKDIYKDKSLAKKYDKDDQSIFSNKKPIKNEIIHENNKIYKIYKTPILDNNKNTIGLTGISIDITEQQNLISNLTREYDLLQGLMDNIPDTIYFKDKASRFTRINKAQAEMIGIEDPEDAIGKTDFDFFNKELAENAFKDEQELMKSGKAILSKLEKLINARGETKYVTATKMPLRNSKDEIIGMVGISRDVTETILAEKELIKAKRKVEESEKLKSAFLANISHQIRTPMNGIIGFLNLLEKNNVSENEKDECIKYIKKSSKQLLNLINKIIIISEIESGQIEINKSETHLNVMLKELYEGFKGWINEDPTKDIKLKLSLKKHDDKFTIITDPYRLRDIMENLIENAIKFTDKGIVEFGYKIKNNEIIFFVKDTGTGIPQDKINVIFKRFDQSLDNGKIDHEGTGIGLTITKYLVSKLGGTINVKSKHGKGSEFTFNIALKTSTA